MMRAILFVLTLLAVVCGVALVTCTEGCASVASTGSVYRDPCTHVGVRPAAASETEWAASVQITTDYPGCAR